jgi:hypothetical protein
VKLVKEEDITWDSRPTYVFRDGELMSTTNWREINEGELYCNVFQTPTTPADFGLILNKRKSLVILEDYNEAVPIDDEFIDGVENFDYVNYNSIKRFLLREGEFHNWYDKK